jgi:hypothetical protein
MATADQTLEEVEGHFEFVSGLPVVDSARRCVGVLVKSDRTRASHGVSFLLPHSLSVLHMYIHKLLPQREKNKTNPHPHTYTSCYLISEDIKTSCLLIHLLLVATVKDKDCTSDDLSSDHAIM